MLTVVIILNKRTINIYYLPTNSCVERTAPDDIIRALLNALKEGGQNLTHICKASGINRITAAKYLKAMVEGNTLICRKQGRETIYLHPYDNNAYYKLPLTKEEKQLFDTYYHHIKRLFKELFNKEPSPIQVAKILWILNRDQKLELPIAWYKQGPVGLQAFNGDEPEAITIPQEKVLQVKETVAKYGKHDDFKIKTVIYNEHGDQFYITKDELVSRVKKKLVEENDRNWFRNILRDLIKYAPREAIDIISDFANTALLVDWCYAKPVFDAVWEYATTINYKEDLKEFYEPDCLDERIGPTLKQRRESAKNAIKEAMEHVKIDTIEDFKKAISVWGDQPDNIPTRTKEERKQLHKDFLKNKKRSDVFKNVGL
jgi:predicted transcriptional regulator